MPATKVSLPDFQPLRSMHGAASLPLLRREGALLEVQHAAGTCYLPAAWVDRADHYPVLTVVRAALQAAEEVPHDAPLLGPHGVDAALRAALRTGAAVLTRLSETRAQESRHAAIDRDLESGLLAEAAEALRPIFYTVRSGKLERWVGGSLEDLGTLTGAYTTVVNVHAAVTHPFVRERCLALHLRPEQIEALGAIKQRLYEHFTTVARSDAGPETSGLQIRVARALLLEELRLLWSQVQWALPPSEQERFAMGRLLGRAAPSARPEPPPVVGPTPPVAGPTPPVAGPTPPIAGPTPPVAGPAPPLAGPTPPVSGPTHTPAPFAGAPLAGPAAPTPAPLAGLVVPPPLAATFSVAAAAPGTVLGTVTLPGQPPCSLVVQADGTPAWVFPAAIAAAPASAAAPEPAAPSPRGARRSKRSPAAAPPPGRTRRR